MVGACKECDRLWQEYTEAAKAHLKVVSQYQVAIIEQNFSSIDALYPLCRDSEKARAFARMAVKEHEAAAHNGK